MGVGILANLLAIGTIFANFKPKWPLCQSFAKACSAHQMWYLDVMAIMRYRLSLQHDRSFQDLAIALVMASQDILVVVPF